MSSNFLERLENSSSPILADGAMGTVLHERGTDFTECFDELNLTHPDIVAQIHQEYIAAGAQLIMSNTFGGNRYRLAEHGLDDQVFEINKAGVEIARQAAEESASDVIVAGDLGPLGVRLAPFGRVQLEDARAAFTEQIKGLIAGQPDLILIETMTDIYEVREAVLAAKALSDLPVLASMTFTRDDRTLLGDPPRKIARKMVEAGVDVIGINCSGGPAQLLRIMSQMRKAAPDAKFSVMPNAGWPESSGGRIMYPAGPDYFGRYALSFREGGAVIIGGCCGTTPKHISAMRTALAETTAEEYEGQRQIRVVDRPVSLKDPEKGSELADKLAAGKFVFSVEMHPPRGLTTNKLLAGCDLLGEAGVDVINLADSPMARMRMSPWAACQLVQQEIGLETTLHFPTRGRNLLRIQGDLLAAHALGVRNVFVVMGDPTAVGDYPEAMDNYDLAPTGLIKLITEGFNSGFDHAGTQIGQPTSFHVGAALNLQPAEAERELRVLKRKLRNGTDFFLTQPIYEPKLARRFIEEHIPDMDKPVLAGILPLYGARHAAFLHNEVPGIIIPKKIRERLEDAGDDSPQEGIRIALETIEELHDWAAGVYLMPAFARYDLTAQIIEKVK
jgi:homocysteine S-methyltransferase